MSKQLISYCGFLGAGKGFISQKHISDLKFDGNSVFLTAWADPLKHLMTEKLGIMKSGLTTKYNKMDKNRLYATLFAGIINAANGQDINGLMPKYIGDMGWKFDRAWKEHGDVIYQAYANIEEDHKKYQRTLIQMIGTELGRAVREDIWIAATLKRVEAAFIICDHVIVDDCRFINEYTSLVNFAEEHGCDLRVYGIDASRETRARRRGLTVEEVIETESHQSEYETAEIFKRLPDYLIIDNNEDA